MRTKVERLGLASKVMSLSVRTNGEPRPAYRIEEILKGEGIPLGKGAIATYLRKVQGATATVIQTTVTEQLSSAVEHHAIDSIEVMEEIIKEALLYVKALAPAEGVSKKDLRSDAKAFSAVAKVAIDAAKSRWAMIGGALKELPEMSEEELRIAYDTAIREGSQAIKDQGRDGEEGLAGGTAGGAPLN